MSQAARALALMTAAILCSCARSLHDETLRGPPAGLKNSRQVVLVDPVPGAPTTARVRAFDAVAGGWKLALGPFPAVIGRAGFAPPDEKREGDGRTPTGIFPLEMAFGYAPALQTGLRYRQARANDIWVDDLASDDYNEWAVAPTSASSFERMRRDDGLYEIGAVIGYNRFPVVKGLGSAIFLHVWRGPDSPTAGCVALPKRELQELLAWLDATKSPAIVLGSE